MKVIVKDNYLNVRVGSPSVNAPCYQYLAPGSEITVDGQLYKGDRYDSIDTWLRDEAGNYYWSGGVEVNASIKNAIEETKFGWSINLFGIDKIWRKTKGNGVKVAIIDTGIDLSNTDLSSASLKEKRYNVLNHTDNVQDTNYHGTYCCSIVASRGKNGIIGIAPACDLIVIKINEKNTIYTSESEIEAQEKIRLIGINKAVELGADIISMSFGSTKENSTMRNRIKDIMQSGVICIAAAGNISNGDVNYPANIKDVISVGNVKCLNPVSLFERGEFELSSRSPKSIVPGYTKEGITIVAPGDGIEAYDIYGRIVPNISGTSYSTSYVAGVAALWLATMRIDNMSIDNYHHSFRDFIIKNANSNSANYNKTTWGAGIINPFNMLTI